MESKIPVPPLQQSTGGVWRQVVRAEDPPIDVNRTVFVPAELSRLLNGSGVKSVVDL
jgi:hypothetical protein